MATDSCDLCLSNGKLLEIVAEIRTVFATVSATCLATFSAVARYVTLCNVSYHCETNVQSVTAP